jgi:hypothetical protein
MGGTFRKGTSTNVDADLDRALVSKLHRKTYVRQLRTSFSGVQDRYA